MVRSTVSAPETLTIDGLENLYNQLVAAHNKRARLDVELDDLFFNVHAVEVVESPVLGVEPEVLRLGRVPAAMNLICGLFDEYPRYSMLPLGIGINAMRVTERVEKFLNAAVKQAEREEREDTYGMTVQETLRFGRSFEVATRADHAAWADYPKRRGKGKRISDKDYNKKTEEFKMQAPLPISVRHLPIAPSSDGISALPLMAGGKMIRFIRVTKMQVSEILERYGKDDKQGRRPQNLAPLREALEDTAEGTPALQLTDQIKMIEYYDAKRVVYAMMDVPYRGILREWMHGMNDLPVVMFEGILTGDPNPERRWKSVYHDARETVLHEDRLASRQATNIRINYYKSYYGLSEETGSGQVGREKVIEFEPGKLTVLRGLKQFGAVNTETASQEAELLGTKIERMLERHLLPSVLMGVQGAHDEPAWGTNLRIRQAERRFKTVANHLAAGRVQIGQGILRIVIAIGERVYAVDEDDIEWSITPDEAKKFMNRIRVKIEPKTIIDRNADVQAAQGQIELGLPRRVVFEDTLGYEQPVELMRERILEDLQFDPGSPLYQRTVEDIMRQVGILDEQAETATDEEIEEAQAEIGPGAARAIMSLVGGDGSGGVPTDFIPGGGRPMSPAAQAQMKTGRRQGRQPRPRKAPRSVRATGG
ncbi:hypothetical protein LCGC14_0968990 [marine sediment metagenome]|uniref:Portal protein n=1 Tax=marine sediment metagenome TaxID=412755 RepID=A0A0F9RIL1_9ZZZZ